MANSYEYMIEVTTGSMQQASTFDNLFVTMIGTEGESERTVLPNFGLNLLIGPTWSYTVTTFISLGLLLLLKLEKNTQFPLPENEWYCSKIVVTTPDNFVITFPCFRWISRGDIVMLRGGPATKAFEDIQYPQLVSQRQNELLAKKQLYQWTLYGKGVSYILNIKNPASLPADMTFSFPKSLEFNLASTTRATEHALKGLSRSMQPWSNFKSMEQLFDIYKTPMTEYVVNHWKEDELFGYQFLNGANPNLIQRCSHLPFNFPVTEKMVNPFLAKGSSLAKEMMKGNIFICDYEMLDGLPTNYVGGKPAPLAAAMCLLYLTPENTLIPIAIQLGQQPSGESPIFLPSDSETDWLLAKMFVRNADFILHEFVEHLQNTHFMAEVFSLATLRNLPSIHPLNKLLIPHHRHTLYINTLAREQLVGPGNPLDDSTLNSTGTMELMKRALSATTYSALYLPENIAARGLESIPNYYYRDDALRLWNIIYRFVRDIVNYYYPSDRHVIRDSELQQWIHEIFTYGFLANINSGVPEKFQKVEEVIRFVTMVIYKSSVQHAAVNGGQFDYFSWPPNAPFIMRKPPPTTKGQSSLKTIWETLPLKGDSCLLTATTWVLSKKYSGFIPLGMYPEERFDEAAPKMIIRAFQAELSTLSKAISKRNAHLRLPYIYLMPTEIENSISL